MILLDDALTLTLEGVTVFRHHEKGSRHFSYLPTPVRIARRGDDDRAQFTCLTYRSDDPNDEEGNGGFLMVETDLAVPPDVLTRMKAQLRSLVGGEPTLTPVLFDEGTVRIVALDLEGGGGTVAPGDQPGTFRAVDSILGTRNAMLAGDQNAAFSLDLSKQGAIILKKAFEQGATPVGAIYEFKYTGLRPALDVKLTADLSRVYNHFSASIEGQYAWLKGGIEVALDFLRQEGAITVEVIDFTSAQDQADKEKWALDFFAQHLLATWFTPSFSPEKAAAEGGDVKLPTVDDVKKAAGGLLGGDKKDEKKDEAKDGEKKDEAKKDEPAAGKDDKKEAGTATPAPKPPPAELVITSKAPDPLPAGLQVTHKPAAEGTAETIAIAGSPATVKVGGAERPLGADGTVVIDVAAGATHEIEVTWAEVPAKEESFELFFDFDEPAKAGFSPVPSNRLFSSYLNDTVADDRFRGSTAPSGGSAATGSAALRAWIRDRLVSPKQVRIHAKASFEGHGELKRGHNQELSERRLQVAKGVIGALASVVKGEATGQDPAENETPLRDEKDRVALVTGVVQPARTAATLKATLKRAKPPEQPADKKDDKKDEKKDDKKDEKKDEGGSKGSTSAALAFKLKFVHQNERKTVTIHYNRQEAVQRPYVAQGFFGLLLDDLDDKASHFINIDLNDEFFRTMEITVAAPFDLAALGISSAQVALDYGAAGDPDRRHADMVFTPDDHAEQRLTLFLNAAGDTTYQRSVQYHFDPASGWDGSGVVVERPAIETADRTLLLNPFEDLAFLQVEVIPGRIDEELISAIDVDLEIVEPDGTPITRTLRVRPGGAPQLWKVRSLDPDARQYRYRLTHLLKDGTTRQQGPFTATAPVIQVDDPFTDALEIDFVRLFDPGTTRMALIDVLYEDAPNSYRRDERLTMRSEDPELHLRMALLDPAQTEFRYRLTVVGADNTVRQDAFVTTTDSLVLVQ
jgi:hypothetical protein